MQNAYSTLFKSVVRAVNDAIKEIKSTVPGHDDLRYWSWESRIDEDKMPRVPLMGVNGFNWDENGGMWIVRFGITISTVDDANLHDEADVIDIAHKLFGEKRKVLMRHPTTGAYLNELVVTEFEVHPMGQTQLRNYRPISVELKLTGTDGE